MATTWSQKESGHTTLTHAYEGLMSWGCPPYYSSMLSDLRLEKAEKAFCCIEGMALSLPSLAPSGGRWLVHRPQAMLSPITQNFQNKQNQSNKNPTASKPPPLKFPRMSHDKGKWEGFRSQAPEIWQLPPLQQAHPDTTGTAAGSGRHWAAGGFLFWKQNPADIEAAESGEGTLCFSLEKPGERWNHSNLNPNFAPVLEKIERRKTQEGLASLWDSFLRRCRERGGATDLTNTLKTVKKHFCHHGYPATTRGTSHLSVPRKSKQWLSWQNQTSQQVADYACRSHLQQVLSWGWGEKNITATKLSFHWEIKHLLASETAPTTEQIQV